MKRVEGIVKLIIVFFILASTRCFADNDSSIVNNVGFYKHLIRNGEYESLFNLTQHAVKEGNTNKELNFYYSLAALHLEKYDCIIKNEINWQERDSSEVHFNVLIIESIAAIKLKKDSIVKAKLNTLLNFGPNEKREDLIFLLTIYDTIVSQKKTISGSSITRIDNLPILTPEDAKDVIKSIHGIEHPSHKSALLAGTMSAIIPGAGKWYAGYFGTPFASLFINTVLGGVAVELAIKQGWTSWPAILGYTAFSAFYAGNIIGTVYSVNIKKKENEAFYKGVLLYHLMSAFERHNAS